MLLSAIVPCYNEELVLQSTCERLLSVLRELKPLGFEIIFIDDGSTDNTMPLLSLLRAEDHRIRVLGLSRNFGHQVAVTAGLDHCSGDAVVIIDADLQDPPELIEDMYMKWKEGYAVAYAKRRSRDGESQMKKLTAKIFYRMLQRITAINIPVDTGDFRLIDKKIVEVLKKMPEQQKFL